MVITVLLFSELSRYFSRCKMSKKSKARDSDLDDFQDPGPSPSHATPARLTNFPAGHCLVSEKWRNNSVSKSIARVMTVKLLGGLGVVDFQPSPNLVVLYLLRQKATLSVGWRVFSSKWKS